MLINLSIQLLAFLGASDEVSKHSSAAVQFSEILLFQTASILKIILECIAIIIVAIAMVKALQRLLYHRHGRMMHRGRVAARIPRESVRLELGHALALSLEFLLAADIVGTAVSPSWTDIGKLAAITAIRTFVNYFIQKEVEELEHHMKQQGVDDSEIDALITG
ncbi:protein of unknown function DUF1622 [Thalassoporum mexicanum PCC 7367]|uniref:DUF1622 domain-containing protein n=1 Tax=Thalassoporum mexicanum TaxID=3457544 RepID=UPI00029F8CC2|nr:DUF1622 domain-containing protein [Pseudanabaena sp. PCC 7367]AFY69131.1 protein of unknown function DUF1622 [Pseudanabaena sp. PCC 7367]